MDRSKGLRLAATFGLCLACALGAPVEAASLCQHEALAEEFSAATAASTLFGAQEWDVVLKANTAIETQVPVDRQGAVDASKEQQTAQLKLPQQFTLKSPDAVVANSTRAHRDQPVRTADGRTVTLLQGTNVNLDLPDIPSGYIVEIPAGTSINKSTDATPKQYQLVEDTPAVLFVPSSVTASLTVAAGQVVVREPSMSGTGTTLGVTPRRAPAGGQITLTAERVNFEFAAARFFVCLRQRGVAEANWVDADYEVTTVQRGKAQLNVQVPDIGEFLGTPVVLVFVARTPEGARAEVMTRQLTVSSRFFALLVWLLAALAPWGITALVMTARGKGQGWGLDPIWYVSGKYGNASLSLAQILLWTILVFSGSFYVLIVSGALLELHNQILTLLGIAGGSSVIAKIAAVTKDDKGRDLLASTAAADARAKARSPADKQLLEPQKTMVKTPRWLDLFQTEGRPDLYKVQMALFTVLAAVYVTIEIYTTLQFPELPGALLALIGISNGVYLTAKASGKTVFEKLAEKHKELESAKDRLAEYEAAAATAQKLFEEATNRKNEADNRLNETKEKYSKETDPAEQAKLQALQQQQQEIAKQAEDALKAAAEAKTEADSNKTKTEERVKALEDEFKELKQKALPAEAE